MAVSSTSIGFWIVINQSVYRKYFMLYSEDLFVEITITFKRCYFKQCWGMFGTLYVGYFINHGFFNNYF